MPGMIARPVGGAIDPQSLLMAMPADRYAPTGQGPKASRSFDTQGLMNEINAQQPKGSRSLWGKQTKPHR